MKRITTMILGGVLAMGALGLSSTQASAAFATPKYRYQLDVSNPGFVSCIKTPKDCEIRKRDGLFPSSTDVLVWGEPSAFQVSGDVINIPLGW